MNKKNQKYLDDLLQIYEKSEYKDINLFIKDFKNHFRAKSTPNYHFNQSQHEPLKEIFKTKRGQILNGNSLIWLLNGKNKSKVDLIVTSPPFGLTKKKAYGNVSADQYCEWFRSYAEGFANVLKDEGSLVIDIAGAWEPGNPIKSLYQYEVLLMLCNDYGFNLCQEHFWWNPSKLPSPAQWVNIERSRVKDSVNCIWWLSKSKNPKASNIKVLGPYSKSMEKVFKEGVYTGVKPSGHQVTDRFLKNNGGSIPPNLLAIANSESRGHYFDFCKKMDIPVHPARFPNALPEYFIRFLTDKNDLVIDPFGGSCVTGYVAENLGRKWKSFELRHDYALGGAGRFLDPEPYKSFVGKYEISSPFQASSTFKK